MKQQTKPLSSCQNTSLKTPQNFLKRLVQLSEKFQVQEILEEGMQVIQYHHQISQNSLQSRRSQKKNHLNLPLKHLLTILENKSCPSSQLQQQ